MGKADNNHKCKRTNGITRRQALKSLSVGTIGTLAGCNTPFGSNAPNRRIFVRVFPSGGAIVVVKGPFIERKVIREMAKRTDGLSTSRTITAEVLNWNPSIPEGKIEEAKDKAESSEVGSDVGSSIANTLSEAESSSRSGSPLSTQELQDDCVVLVYGQVENTDFSSVYTDPVTTYRTPGISVDNILEVLGTVGIGESELRDRISKYDIYIKMPSGFVYQFASDPIFQNKGYYKINSRPPKLRLTKYAVNETIDNLDYGHELKSVEFEGVYRNDEFIPTINHASSPILPILQLLALRRLHTLEYIRELINEEVDSLSETIKATRRQMAKQINAGGGLLGLKVPLSPESAIKSQADTTFKNLMTVAVLRRTGQQVSQPLLGIETVGRMLKMSKRLNKTGALLKDYSSVDPLEDVAEYDNLAPLIETPPTSNDGVRRGNISDISRLSRYQANVANRHISDPNHIKNNIRKYRWLLNEQRAAISWFENVVRSVKNKADDNSQLKDKLVHIMHLLKYMKNNIEMKDNIKTNDQQIDEKWLVKKHLEIIN